MPSVGQRTRGKRNQHRAVPDPLAAKVGKRIRDLRREKQISFDAFVGETELGRGTVSELERGLVVPTIGTLARIAEVLEVALLDLVTFPTEDARQDLVDLSRNLPQPQLKGMVREIKTFLTSCRNTKNKP